MVVGCWMLLVGWFCVDLKLGDQKLAFSPSLEYRPTMIASQGPSQNHPVKPANAEQWKETQLITHSNSMVSWLFKNWIAKN